MFLLYMTIVKYTNHCTISFINLKWKTRCECLHGYMLIFKYSNVFIHSKYYIVQMNIVLYVPAASISGGAWIHSDGISFCQTTLSTLGSAAFHSWMSCQFLVVEIWRGGVIVFEKPQEGKNVLSHWLHSHQKDTLKDTHRNSVSTNIFLSGHFQNV